MSDNKSTDTSSTVSPAYNQGTGSEIFGNKPSSGGSTSGFTSTNEEKNYYDKKASFWTFAKWALGVFIALVGIFGGIWIYTQQSIRTPIIQLEEGQKNNKEDIEKNSESISDQQKQIQSLQIEVNGVKKNNN